MGTSKSRPEAPRLAEWTRLISKVFQMDPLTCREGGEISLDHLPRTEVVCLATVTRSGRTLRGTPCRSGIRLRGMLCAQEPFSSPSAPRAKASHCGVPVRAA